MARWRETRRQGEKQPGQGEKQPCCYPPIFIFRGKSHPQVDVTSYIRKDKATPSLFTSTSALDLEIVLVSRSCLQWIK